MHGNAGLAFAASFNGYAIAPLSRKQCATRGEDIDVTV